MDELKEILQKKGKSDLDIALIVSGVSGNRTTILEELKRSEIDLLLKIYRPVPYAEMALKLEQEKELKRLRSIILADAQYIGLYKPGNWTRFNNFMQKRSVLKKGLNRYQLHEFAELIKQFKSMRYKFDRDKLKTGTAAWFSLLGTPSMN